MQPFATLLSIDKSSKTPVFLQIATGLTTLIRRGVMPPGARLPGTRALAQALEVHRKTVIAAYDELIAQGWIDTRASSGTFVSQRLPITPAAEPATVPAPLRQPGFDFKPNPLLARPVIKRAAGLAFDDGFPDVRLAPWDAFNRAYRTVVRKGIRKNLLYYGDTAGEYSLREAMANYLRETRGLPVGPDNVLITRGSTMGIYLAAQTLLKPGEVVIVGAISYGAANMIFQQAGATLATVPVDSHGLDIAAIGDICQKMPVRMVYVTPHHHYPTTVTMPAERRLRLLQLAREHGFCILEDDYDYDFHYDGNPVPPLAAVDTKGYVLYTGSLCKAIAPALRVGYIVAPVTVIEALGQLRRLIDRQGDNLLEATITLLFQEGELSRHLKKVQKVYHQRRDLFCRLLREQLGETVTFHQPSGGMAVWVQFAPECSLPALAAHARTQGLAIPDGTFYAPGMNATRLGFASVREEEMEDGMRILGALMQG